MEGGSKVNGQHPVRRLLAIQIKEDKNRSTHRDELHSVFLAMVEELNDDKSPYVLVVTDLFVGSG